MRWHEPDGEPPKGVVILLHGLNTHPDAMRPLAGVVTDAGFAAGILPLPGADCRTRRLRADDYLTTLDRGVSEAQIRHGEIPLLLLGYSLGGTVAVNYLIEKPESVQGLILLAPAIRLTWVRWPMALTHLIGWSGISLPSVAPRDYRSCNFTPLQSYTSLRELQLRIERVPASLSEEPVLVLSARDDFLVSYSRLEAWIEENGLKWELETIEPWSESKYPSHLILDEPSLGPKEWARMAHLLKEFLARRE